MDTPTTRVLAVLELLQNHDEISGAQLAGRLGVDERTLRRYIAKLQALGIPVVSERGRYGAYRLTPGFKLPPMMFTDDEALALSLGLRFARQSGSDVMDAGARSAQTKLERVMPKPLRDAVRAIGETVQLDVSPSAAGMPSQFLLALSAATHQRRRVKLWYSSAKGEATERDVDSYGLAWRAGSWYVVGHCHLRGALRSFRLDRIRQVEPMNVRFDAPENFDAVRHLALGLASLPRAHSISVRLKTDLATAQAELFDSIGLFTPQGRDVLLHSQADDLAWYARQLAQLPFDFEIIDPPALRQALRDCATRLRRLAAPSLRPNSQPRRAPVAPPCR